MKVYQISQLFLQGESAELLNGQKLKFIDLKPKSNSEARAFLKGRSGIYGWYAPDAKKIYIGSAKCFWARLRGYKNSFLKDNGRNNIKLRNYVNKHGMDKIKFCVIEYFMGSTAELELKEQEYFDKFSPFDNNGFNIYKKAARTASDFVNFSEKSRKKISDRHTGENSETAKLKDENIIEIKNELAKGVSLKVLANKFGVSTTVISNIKRLKSWDHIKASDEVEAILAGLVEKHKHKYSRELVQAVKRDLLKNMKMTEIAPKYGLVYSSVASIKNGHIYSYIPAFD